MAMRTVHTVCSHDCPDSCGVLVTVDETGKATRVQGDPAHPVTRGFLCGKVAKYLDRVYAPDRLLYPMRRRKGAPKGPGRELAAFERISWDEALDEIAARLKAVSEEFGPESILPYSYAGSIGLLTYGSMDRRFFHRLGASQLDRTICSTTGGEAYVSVYGSKLGTDTEDFRHARLILAWGANIHGNNIHLWPFVEEARRNGAKLVVIDPYETRTAALADWHISIRPGTDAALALGMMHVLVRDGLLDEAYIRENTHGFERLAEHVKPYTPAMVEAATGVAAADVERLARMYGETQPSAIRMNYGVQRSENGGASSRAILMLPALTGAWKYRGGGAQLSTSGGFAWDKAAVERPDLMASSPLGRPSRVINMVLLGQALADRENPVKAMFVYNSNPAAVAPDQAAVLRGLAREDLFTVVHEQFLTDTVDYADIVLPATTFLEQREIQGAYGHYYVQLSEQAIDPVGESRPNTWVFAQLARRMGFEEECFRDSVDDMIRQALQEGGEQPERLQGITLGLLEKHPMQRLRGTETSEETGQAWLPFAQGPFATPSGKIEFYSEAMEAQGLDAMPAFYPPKESRMGAGRSERDARYPLEFLGRKADNYMNSTFANLSGHQKLESEFNGVLEMHPEDAEARGIADGALVTVWNDRGELPLMAKLSRRVGRGVVAGRLHWNKLSQSGHNVNLLTGQHLTDMGGGPAFYSVLVEVRPADSF
ncbi:MAG: molybdopterin-containing oxidoreductase family protein [Acidobacteriaceae bacterium]